LPPYVELAQGHRSLGKGDGIGLDGFRKGCKAAKGDHHQSKAFVEMSDNADILTETILVV
jgi:hypothetical protein